MPIPDSQHCGRSQGAGSWRIGEPWSSRIVQVLILISQDVVENWVDVPKSRQAEIQVFLEVTETNWRTKVNYDRACVTIM